MPNIKLRRRWRRSRRALGFFLERGLGAFQISLHQPFKMDKYTKAQITVAISVVLVEVLGQLGIARRFLLGDHAVVVEIEALEVAGGHPVVAARFGRRGIRPGIAGGQRSKAKWDDYFFHDNSLLVVAFVQWTPNQMHGSCKYHCTGRTSVRCDQYKWC